MITFSKIGRKGNLGNQLFQIASTIGLAIENELDYGFLAWQYQQYFKNKLPPISELPNEITTLPEKHFHHYHWDFKKDTDFDLVGWLQSEKYFDSDKTKHYFEFEEDLVAKIKTKYAATFEKKTVLLSIRRGDFVNHPDYLQLSIKFYLNALARFFPDWTSRNLIVLSDDIDYCKFHFSFLDNAYFGDGLNAMEQLCLGSLCDDFIIGNSTFSWWSAWLGEKQNSKVICPHQNFDGQKRLECDDKDYFPERWISYNASNEKVNLNEVTFHLDFKSNHEIVSSYLSHYFDAEILSGSTVPRTLKYAYIFKKDYFVPPVLVYYSALKKSYSPVNTIINQVTNVFKVSRKLNYEEFLQQQDFGMFSTIFSFKGNTSHKSGKDIYIENTNALQHSNTIIIETAAGQFSNTGFAFSFKRYLKTVEISLKRTVKKLLFIKK
ncbi:alpha-1,2-fucosyltransferase [Flavobacterium sp.]|uniref:alpha-1,2-fucosyltransferase n=1 Tax=Flavobacterium sp. TaxID=239 RepID=UPI00262AB9FC|nr:alpha-1,2-fucosyltransferase [Flavobacterium sp.]